MANITGIITAQKFELVRDRLALILADELANQADLTENALFDADIFVERLIPVNDSEYPLINIAFGRMSADSESPTSQRTENSYFIDIYTKSEHTSSVPGDKQANLDAQKLAGVMRAILESPHYKWLDFTAKFISTRSVSEIEMQEPENKSDSVQTAKARLIYDITLNETVEVISTEGGEIFITQWKIDTSEKGFKLTLDNS